MSGPIGVYKTVPCLWVGYDYADTYRYTVYGEIWILCTGGLEYRVELIRATWATKVTWLDMGLDSNINQFPKDSGIWLLSYEISCKT